MKTRHACELTMSWVRSKREPLFIANMQTTHMCEPSMSGAGPRLDDLGTVFKCSPHKFRIFTNPSPFSTLGTYTQYILCPLFSYPFSPSQCWHHLSMAPYATILKIHKWIVMTSDSQKPRPCTKYLIPMWPRSSTVPNQLTLCWNAYPW